MKDDIGDTIGKTLCVVSLVLIIVSHQCRISKSEERIKALEAQLQTKP